MNQWPIVNNPQRVDLFCEVDHDNDVFNMKMVKLIMIMIMTIKTLTEGDL